MGGAESVFETAEDLGRIGLLAGARVTSNVVKGVAKTTKIMHVAKTAKTVRAVRDALGSGKDAEKFNVKHPMGLRTYKDMPSVKETPDFSAEDDEDFNINAMYAAHRRLSDVSDGMGLCIHDDFSTYTKSIQDPKWLKCVNDMVAVAVASPQSLWPSVPPCTVLFGYVSTPRPGYCSTQRMSNGWLDTPLCNSTLDIARSIITCNRLFKGSIRIDEVPSDFKCALYDDRVTQCSVIGIDMIDFYAPPVADDWLLHKHFSTVYVNHYTAEYAFLIFMAVVIFLVNVWHLKRRRT